MSWEIVLGIIALVGLIGTFVGVAWKISTTLATLDVTIRTLRQTLDELRADSKETHGDIYEKINDHDKRICIIEAAQN